jgi:hypothetical protein
MLTLVFSDLYILLPTLNILFFSWFLFFKFNFVSLKTNFLKNDTLFKQNQIKIKLFVIFNKFLLSLLLLLFTFFLTLRGNNTLFF